MNQVELNIRTRLDTMFAPYTPSTELTELKEELVADLQEAYAEHLAVDSNEEEALDDAFERLGDITPLLDDITGQDHQAATEASEQATNAEKQTKDTDYTEGVSFENGFHLGNLHIDHQGLRIGSDIVINGKDDKIKVGDWLNVDHEGARVGNKHYRFEDFDFNIDNVLNGDVSEKIDIVRELRAPVWTKADRQTVYPVNNTELVQQLIFNYRAADIVLIGTDDNQVTISEFIDHDNERYFTTFIQDAEGIQFEQGEMPVLWPLRVRVVVQLPLDVLYNVALHVKSGNVRLLNTKQFNDVTGEINNGDVKIIGGKANNVHLLMKNGNLHVITSELTSLDTQAINGNINLVNADISQVELTAKNGNVKAESFTGAGQIALVNGNLRLRMAKMTGELHLLNKNGAIRVTHAMDQAVSFDLETSYGHVQVPEDATLHDSSQTAKRGFLVEESATHRITASTHAGNIKLY